MVAKYIFCSQEVVDAQVNDAFVLQQPGQIRDVHTEVVVGSGPTIHKNRAVLIVVGPGTGIGVGESQKGFYGSDKVLIDCGKIVCRSIVRSHPIGVVLIVPLCVQVAVRDPVIGSPDGF